MHSPTRAKPNLFRLEMTIDGAKWCLLIASALALAFSPLQNASGATLRELTYLQVVTNVPLNVQINAARSIGVHGLRFAIRWSDVEKSRGQFSWGMADSRVQGAQKAGLAPLITLFGGNASYPPAPGTIGNTPSSGEGLTGFANFARVVAGRYGAGTADAPVIYEIWNEPNTKTFWGRSPEPEGYAEMARGACTAIKMAVPTAKVLVLAMEGTPAKSPYFVKSYGLDIYREWAARAATPDLMACADGFSMHPYLSPPEVHYTLEPELQRFVADHWHKALPAMIAHTEWGYAIDPKRGRTAEDQAALDLRALLIGTGLGRLTNLYQSVDTGQDPAIADQTYGLVTYLGALKPAGVSIKRLLDAIGEYTIDQVQVLDGTPGVYRFSASRGAAQAQVLWTASGTASIQVPPGGNAVDLVTGAARSSDSGRLEVDSKPVLVTWGA